MSYPDNKPVAYVCAGTTCAPPSGNEKELVELIQNLGLMRQYNE